MAVMTKSKLFSLDTVSTHWAWDLADENKVVARYNDTTIVITMPKVWTADGFRWAPPHVDWVAGVFGTKENAETLARQLHQAYSIMHKLNEQFCRKDLEA